MAVPDGVDASDGQQDWPARSYLTYIIPLATDFRLEDALAGATSYRDAFLSIEQREWLFFDETVDVYLILRTPLAGEKELQSSLDKVTISLDAQIANGSAPDRETPQSTEVIFQGTVEGSQKPLIVADEEAEEAGEDGQSAYAVWKLPVFLARPRIRLQNPSVVFSASASVRLPDPGVSDEDQQSGYLPSLAPAGMNLLEPLAGDPAFRGVKPRLSSTRVSRVAPITRSGAQPRAIKGLQGMSLRIFPLAHTRIRFSRPNTSPPSPALIALLEMDFSPFFDCEAVLDKITLHVDDGIVEDLNTQDGMRLPLRCVAHDHVTFLYHLAPNRIEVAGRSSSRELGIAIGLTALVQPDGPNRCIPRLSMAWTAALDFTLPLNPGFGQPLTQPIQRSHRPSQLSIGGGGAESQSLVSPSVSRPDALPSLEAAAQNAAVADVPVPGFGITMTFVGPQQPVRAGEEFSWTVFVVNRAARTELPPATPATPLTIATPAPAPAAAAPSRKLALIAIPRRRRTEPRMARPPSTAAPPPAPPAAKHQTVVADAFVDDNVLHAMQHSGLAETADAICLSADARVGPLATNACAAVELRFLALRAGLLVIEAVRVVDLGSQEHVDVRELPLVVVVEDFEAST